ncbi:MAG: hypothetical protein R3C17_20680 [Planctomycetaceae bacterium]
MIPAILSAVFVIYLYKTLSQPSASDTAASFATSDDGNVQAIAARLSALQARIDRLATTINDGGSKR